MTTDEIRQNNSDELSLLIQQHKKDLSDLRYNHTIAPIENPARIKQLRKDVARMKTVLKQRLLEEKSE